MTGKTRDFEALARAELISGINEEAGLVPEVFMEEKFGVHSPTDYDSLSMLQLIQISDFFDRTFF